jgi:hypothetical protein
MNEKLFRKNYNKTQILMHIRSDIRIQYWRLHACHWNGKDCS